MHSSNARLVLMSSKGDVFSCISYLVTSVNSMLLLLMLCCCSESESVSEVMMNECRRETGGTGTGSKKKTLYHKHTFSTFCCNIGFYTAG